MRLALIALLTMLPLLLPVPLTASHWHSCLGRKVTIRGTLQPDVIYGTDGPDVIVAMGGADTIWSGDGNDRVCGNQGNDTIFGGADFDRAHGGKGQDTCEAERKRSCEL